ncbi:MAG: tRNA lysidine(34) synthetase TilS [Alphaproteobacteria bacterium]|nr:tRNA lysidine(34) synthetase TilS [Alphaproteobacteria bacterium]
MTGGWHHFSTIFDLLDAWFPTRPKVVAVALSGGVDSMALTAILNQWAAESVTIIPMIVDHGLRPDSGQEAQHVEHMARHWGLIPMVLSWKHPPMTTGLMERARHGRYAALALACHHRGIEHLFVAHHQDDCLETAWMRQEMNGPEYGLSGISAITMRYGVTILRPLLGIPKEHLEYSMRAYSVPWVNDPTNSNLHFQRTRARRVVQNWTMTERHCAVKTLNRRAEKRRMDERVLRHLTPTEHGVGYVLVHDFNPLMALQPSDGTICLQSWIHSFTFGPVPRLPAQYRLWQVLCHCFSAPFGRPGRVIATFGGCIFVRHHQQLWIFREHARIQTEPVNAWDQFWDDRIFSLSPQWVQRGPYSSQGSWKQRFLGMSLPQSWGAPHLQYRPCSWAYPHFTTIKERIPVQQWIDYGRISIGVPTEVAP